MIIGWTWWCTYRWNFPYEGFIHRMVWMKPYTTVNWNWWSKESFAWQLGTKIAEDTLQKILFHIYLSCEVGISISYIQFPTSQFRAINITFSFRTPTTSCLFIVEILLIVGKQNSTSASRCRDQQLYFRTDIPLLVWLGGRKLIPRVQTFVIRLSVLRCSCGPDFQNESHIIEGLYSKNIFC